MGGCNIRVQVCFSIIGEFNHGKMHGRGHLQLTNNETYTGEFAEGMVDGEGTFKDKSGKEIKGRWEQGFFQN
jgi:hypothetical protein